MHADCSPMNRRTLLSAWALCTWSLVLQYARASQPLPQRCLLLWTCLCASRKWSGLLSLCSIAMDVLPPTTGSPLRCLWGYTMPHESSLAWRTCNTGFMHPFSAWLRSFSSNTAQAWRSQTGRQRKHGQTYMLKMDQFRIRGSGKGMRCSIATSHMDPVDAEWLLHSHSNRSRKIRCRHGILLQLLHLDFLRTIYWGCHAPRDEPGLQIEVHHPWLMHLWAQSSRSARGAPKAWIWIRSCQGDGRPPCPDSLCMCWSAVAMRTAARPVFC